MGYHQQRYSPLNQINKRTVRRLVPAWNLSLDNNWGEQAQPIVGPKRSKPYGPM